MIAPPPLRRTLEDPEALIKEARARQRRRRLRLLAATLAVAGAVAVGYAVVRDQGGTAVVRVPGGPTVDVKAFAGHGRLAFVSRGVLFVLDGREEKLRRLETPRGATPTDPVFSVDGKWLAYLARRHDPVTNSDRSELWIARADGRSAHRVRGFTAFGLYGWSPRADLVAVTAGPVQTAQPCPCFTPTSLRLVSPSGSARVLARAPWIRSAAWSPDGKQIALGIENDPAFGHPSSIISYPIDGDTPTTWLRVNPQQRLDGLNGALLDPVGWWRGVGIGFWIYGDGATHNLDATPLDLIEKPGARPRLLAKTLSDGPTRVIAAGGGRLAIVADVGDGRGGGRVAWDEKQVQVCHAVDGCRGLVTTPRTVSVDPAWSPDGATLVFAVAPDNRASGWRQSSLARWFGEHRLLLFNAKTGRIRNVPAANGATVPLWSSDGKSLLYVSGDGLWLLPTLTSTPVEIATPLFPPHNWPSYFAQIAWGAQFAWSASS